MMDWHTRFEILKYDFDLSNEDVAEMIGNTPDSVKCVTQPNRDKPRWLKFAILIYEKMVLRMQSLQDEKNSWEHIYTVTGKLEMIDFMDGNIEFIIGNEFKKLPFKKEGYKLEISNKDGLKAIQIYKKK